MMISCNNCLPWRDRVKLMNECGVKKIPKCLLNARDVRTHKTISQHDLLENVLIDLFVNGE